MSVFGVEYADKVTFRTQLGCRWLRIRNLSNSRWATTKRERAQALHRNIAASRALFGAGQIVSLVTARCFDVTRENVERYDTVLGVTLIRLEGMEIRLDDKFVLSYYTSEAQMTESLIADWLPLALDDALPSLGFISLENPSAMFPYDGGSDLFFSGPEERVAFASSHSGWLSDREDGL